MIRESALKKTLSINSELKISSLKFYQYSQICFCVVFYFVQCWHYNTILMFSISVNI